MREVIRFPLPTAEEAALSRRLVDLINQVEITARSHEEYLARRRLKPFLDKMSLEEVIAASEDARLGRIFYLAALGLAASDNAQDAHKFAVIVTTVIPMRWRKGQKAPAPPQVRADLA